VLSASTGGGIAGALTISPDAQLVTGAVGVRLLGQVARIVGVDKIAAVAGGGQHAHEGVVRRGRHAGVIEEKSRIDEAVLPLERGLRMLAARKTGGNRQTKENPALCRVVVGDLWSHSLSKSTRFYHKGGSWIPTQLGDARFLCSW
jgi:hypothetical protein